MAVTGKWMGGRVLEAKTKEVGGVEVGIIAGYTATWDIDRGGAWIPPDRFVRGAFAESIARHKADSRQVRLTWMHRDLIGGIPIETAREDDVGLYGEAEVNLQTKLGAEAYSLAQQGVLVDFSIGWEPIDAAMEQVDGDDVRVITKAEWWHTALVDEPMNPKAQVTDVKTYTVADLEKLSVREIEGILIQSGCWSERAAKTLASGHGIGDPGATDDLLEGWNDSLEEIQAAMDSLRA